MKIRAPTTFIKSAVNPEDFPPPNRPEVAIVGRSNAGKSSFLNAISVSSIAKVSSTPGKTQLLNFFGVGDLYRWVDMPGYGYAKLPQGDVLQWKQMIEGYFESRENVAGLLLVMDVRRDWAQEEEMVCQWAEHFGFSFALILSKVDKLNQKELSARRKHFENLDKEMAIHWISSKSRKGVEAVEEWVYETWIKEAP